MYKRQVLRLEGEVITKSVDIPTTYPIVVGNLRFTTDTIRLKQAETKHQIINLINTGKKNISILSIFKPDYLEVDCTPLTLGKEMMGNLILSLIHISTRLSMNKPEYVAGVH